MAANVCIFPAVPPITQDNVHRVVQRYDCRQVDMIIGPDGVF